MKELDGGRGGEGGQGGLGDPTGRGGAGGAGGRGGDGAGAGWPNTTRYLAAISVIELVVIIGQLVHGGGLF